MQWETVNLDIMDSGAAIMTFNRPDFLNSVNEQFCKDVPAACKVVAERDDIKVLIITGAGKGWSSGGDVSTLYNMTTPLNSKETYDKSTSVVTAIYELSKPVIAAVNGVVAGASTSTCLACDLIIASEQARFGFTFMQLAFCPDSGASYFLTQKVGYHKAAEIIWFGKILSAAEANELGLVNKVVAHDELMKTAVEWAEKLTRLPLITVGLDKKLLRAALKNDYYQQCELEALNQVLCWSSEDFKEGCQAFAEKRKPNFKGR
ncbi:MAG: enoyl-CoA hydratase/isomerase family protein [Syntrophomonadaceae bacterium]|nr:enoyl-CoA hydratase/isomerase family protein [Syntrophomonadaceae bacterium]